MTNLGCGRQAMRRTVSTGQFTCHNQECESHAAPMPATYRVLQDSDWLRLFYVPLVPVSQGDQLVECDSCGEVVTFSQCATSKEEPAVPFVVDAGPKLEITARAAADEQPGSIRLVVGASAGEPLRPSVRPALDPISPISSCGDRSAHGSTPEASPAAAVPAPPQRPAGTTCGLCGAGRTAVDEICDECGGVFIDRSLRSCVRHRIALPTDADCPVCGPDGVHALEPVAARASYFG